MSIDSAALHIALGRRIKERREEQELTQEWLAQQVGRERSSIANLERGKQKISVELLYLLAIALQTTPKTLLPPLEVKVVYALKEPKP